MVAEHHKATQPPEIPLVKLLGIAAVIDRKRHSIRTFASIVGNPSAVSSFLIQPRSRDAKNMSKDDSGVMHCHADNRSESPIIPIILFENVQF